MTTGDKQEKVEEDVRQFFDQLGKERVELNGQVLPLMQELIETITSWPEYQKAVYEKFESDDVRPDLVAFTKDDRRFYISRHGRLKDNETTVIQMGVRSVDASLFDSQEDEKALRSINPENMQTFIWMNYVGVNAKGGSPALTFISPDHFDRYSKNGRVITDPWHGKAALEHATSFIRELNPNIIDA